MLRPVRFVQPDEDIFRAGAAAFTKATGVEVRVDFVGWEDITQQTAVTANTGAGPDMIIGFGDAPHIYADKLVELSDVAEYLGKKYGGWMFVGEKYGKQHGTNNWIGLPFGGTAGPLVWRKSAVNAVGYETPPADLPGFLEMCKKLKAAGKPSGFALGNAVGDGNGTANWLLWSHGGSIIDEEGKVSINSPQTIASLNYLKELYPTFVPGTLAWGDISNNRAYAANELSVTSNGVSLYFSLKNDPATAPIAADTEHSPMPAGQAAQLAERAADAERHGVQAQPLPERRQGLPAVHAGAGAVRALAERQPRLLGASAGGLQGRRGLDQRPEDRDLPRQHEQQVLERLQGPDLGSLRPGQRGIRDGADVRRRRLRPIDAAGSGAGSRTPRPPHLPPLDGTAGEEGPDVRHHRRRNGSANAASPAGSSGCSTTSPSSSSPACCRRSGCCWCS